jgi:hypothetical protein
MRNAAMRVDRAQGRLPDVRLSMCVFAALIGLPAPDAVAASIFAGCWSAESPVMHEGLQELGLSVEQLSAARSDRSRGVIGSGAREALACDFDGEGETPDLFLGDPEQATRVNLDMKRVWGITPAVDERALFEERPQGRSTAPPVSGSL